MKTMKEIQEVCSCECDECEKGNCEKCSCKACDCDGCACAKQFETGRD